MAVNPMQKKARNSFLLGMGVTLIICVIIIAIFYFLVIAPEKKKETERGKEVTAYVLNRDVKSGQEITSDMFKAVTVYASTVPSNYIDQTKIDELYLEDKDGNILYTNSEGKLYIEQKDNEENAKYKYITTTSKDKKTEQEKEKVLIEKDEENGKYYKTKLEDGEKEYIEFTKLPVIAKVNMNTNTLLTTSLVVSQDEIITDDVRIMEYNMLTLPIDVNIGDYVDVRLTFPNGQDFIVISKKEIKNIQGTTVTFELAEQEILMLNSAIVESYIMTASNIYVAKYVEPGMQEKATHTYTPTAEVINLIKADSNIVTKAKNELGKRFDSNTELRNNGMNSSINQYSQEALTNVEEGLKEQIENAQKAREEYLTGLSN